MRRLLALALILGTAQAQEDPRNVRGGRVLPDEGYCDQPLVVKLDDGSWLAVLTTGPGHEGQRGQHVVAVRSADRGRTWSHPVALEPSDGPEASWAVPLAAPSGRVFVFYVFNDSGVRDRRADLLGTFALRWSDDGGATWSERVKVPMRVTAIDRGNDFAGEVLMHWGVSHALVHDGAVLLPFTKIGEYLVEETEAWFLRSPDLLAVDDPAAATWELWPEGERGLRAAGPIASEPCVAALPDGALACVFRTVDGHPLLATSRDGGRSWSPPAAVEDERGLVVRHPRACVRLWRVAETRYLLWTHEVATPTWATGTRNPGWVRPGVHAGGRLRFGPPEILLYDPDPAVRISYPDLVGEADGWYVLETQKSVARTHPVERAWVDALFDAAVEPRAPRGWSYAAWIELPSDGKLPARILRAASGQHRLALAVDEDLALSLDLNDGERSARYTSQPNALEPGAVRHVAVSLDVEAGVLRWFVDGWPLDGGAARERGWERIEVSAPPTPNEKLLVREGAPRSFFLPDGGRFELAPPDGPNALLVEVGTEQTLRLPLGRLARLGLVTTGVGFDPPEDLALPADGTLRLRYADGVEREHTWDLTDSNGEGRGDSSRALEGAWTLVRTSDGARWEGRRLWWQVIDVDALRELEALTLDVRSAVDATGDDAEFALLALSMVAADSGSGAPLSPVRVAREHWNADVFARSADDTAGRGFRDPPRPPALAPLVIGAVSTARAELGRCVRSGQARGRALLASEVARLHAAGE